jgi:hypothetical protein
MTLRFALALVFFTCSAACNGSLATSDAGSDAAVDAGADVDNGAPSTNYPAPHPPLPQMVNAAGGPVLTAPNIYLVFYPNYVLEPDFQSFAQLMSTSAFWGATTSQYGIGPLSYKGTIDLTDSPPTTIGQADIEAWVATELQNGAFGTPDPQAIYTIVYPQGTTVTQPNPISPAFGTVNSCESFDGYHDNTSVVLGDAGPATSFAYAVIPTCGPLPTLTEVISHEWVEAATDPEVTSGGIFTLTGGPNSAFFGPDANHVIWSLLGGGEAADLCGTDGLSAYIQPPDMGGNWVQRTWSNVSAQGSHDPCVPPITQAFFDSAPVLPETVSFTSALTGTVTTQGITIPQGQSKTIEVDLFSDGDPGGPWTVRAADVLSTYYGSYGIAQTLSFAWDRTSGQNGEKLHLTITVTGPSIVGGAHSFMITSQIGTRQMIWPGLVVE